MSLTHDRDGVQAHFKMVSAFSAGKEWEENYEINKCALICYGSPVLPSDSLL